MILKDLLNFLKITQKCIYIIHEIAYRGTAEKKSNQKELHDDNIDWLCVRGEFIQFQIQSDEWANTFV